MTRRDEREGKEAARKRSMHNAWLYFVMVLCTINDTNESENDLQLICMFLK